VPCCLQDIVSSTTKSKCLTTKKFKSLKQHTVLGHNGLGHRRCHRGLPHVDALLFAGLRRPSRQQFSHLVYDLYSRLHQSGVHRHLQLDLQLRGRVLDGIRTTADSDRIRRLLDPQNLPPPIRQLLRLHFLHRVFQGEIRGVA
jgi:hypothetical protein